MKDNSFANDLIDLCDKWELSRDEIREELVKFNEMLDFLENNQQKKRH